MAERQKALFAANRRMRQRFRDLSFRPRALKRLHFRRIQHLVVRQQQTALSPDVPVGDDTTSVRLVDESPNVRPEAPRDRQLPPLDQRVWNVTPLPPPKSPISAMSPRRTALGIDPWFGKTTTPGYTVALSRTDSVSAVPPDGLNHRNVISPLATVIEWPRNPSAPNRWTLCCKR